MYTTSVGIKRTLRTKAATAPKKEEQPTEFGTLIKIKRAVDKLTLRGAARQIGIEHSGLSELERGMRRPDFETIAKVSDGLGIPLGELARAAAIDLKIRPAASEEDYKDLALSLSARAEMFPDLRKILGHLAKTDPERYRAFLVMFQMWEQQDAQDDANPA